MHSFGRNWVLTTTISSNRVASSHIAINYPTRVKRSIVTLIQSFPPLAHSKLSIVCSQWAPSHFFPQSLSDISTYTRLPIGLLKKFTNHSLTQS